jgi:PTH1 family peptidyl-tRNA hydrolase
VEGGRLVVGLGNPEPRYERTRHNIGFTVVDELLARSGGGSWQEKFSGLTARVSIGGTRAMLLKPMTYMNLSGKSVCRAARYHRFEPQQILVIHDDLDLDFHVVRVKEGGGTGGHKGLASCKADLGSAEFVRVRMGIGRPPYGDATDYVLSSFSDAEKADMTDVIALGADVVETIVAHGVVRAMNRYNKREGGRHES